MSTSSIALQAPSAVSIAEGSLKWNQLVAQRNAVLEAMQRVMKEGTDYGTIPGTPKPTLYKPGSEKILSMFHLAAEPRVEDLSTPDRVHYRVFVTLTHAPSGVVLGTGIGEASSAETKYQWRAVICDEEWNDTPEDRRRTKWKKGDRNAYCIRQVRADMDDIANTVLKMAKKRAQIDATLTCTAASDMFSQDIEDLKDAGLDPAIGEQSAPATEPLPNTLQSKPPAQGSTTHQPPSQPAPHAQAAQTTETITEGEGKLFWAKAISRTNDYRTVMEYLKTVQGVTNKSQLLKSRFKEALLWAETGRTA